MALDLDQIRADAEARRAGNSTAGISFSSDAAKENLSTKIAQAQQKKDMVAETTTPVSNVPAPAPVAPTPQTRLDELSAEQKAYLSQIAEANKGMGTVRQTAYEKIFGTGSAIQEFFNPAIQAAEQGITDVTEFIRKLPDDVLDESLGAALTDAQARRITGKRAGELSDTLAELTSSYERLTAGRDTALRMGELEYNAMVADATDQITATVTEVTNLYNLSKEESAALKAELEANLAATTELKTGVDSLLQEARNLIYEAGIVPSGAFNQVIEDAYAMAEQGKNLGEIQAGIFSALEQNEAIRNYIASQGLVSGGGGSGGGGGGGSGSDYSMYDSILNEVTDANGNIDYTKLEVLPADVRAGVVQRYGELLGLTGTDAPPEPVADPTFLPGSPGATVFEGVTSPLNPNIQGTPANIVSSVWNWFTGKK